MRRIAGLGLMALSLAVLAGCERELILTGERVDIRTPLEDSLPEGEEAGAARVLRAVDALPPENRTEPANLPAAQSLGSWPQRALNTAHRLPHLALAGSLSPLWAADIGQGNDRKHRITADPVSDGQRLYTLDSRARVSAVSTAGQLVWTADLTPPEDGSDEASGGGLALDGGRLFVSSGFGTLTAIEAASGKVIWSQKIGAVGNAAPAISDGLVYVIGRDNRAWAVRASDGKVEWVVSGLPSVSGYIGGGGAAVDSRVAILPFADGGLTAVLKRSGVRSWGTQIAGERVGKVYATVNDIASDPVLDGDILYAANASGRLTAANAGTGERIWTATEGTITPVVLAGGSIYMISDNAEVVRLSAADGTRIWGTKLPDYEKERPRRRKTAFAHVGPILAGGRLIVASTDGLMRFYDPAGGTLTGTMPLGSAASSNPIVVGGTLYIVTGDGRLRAFR